MEQGVSISGQVLRVGLVGTAIESRPPPSSAVAVSLVVELIIDSILLRVSHLSVSRTRPGRGSSRLAAGFSQPQRACAVQ
jgi:hypothetical protein